jgi:hypothetical protein
MFTRGESPASFWIILIPSASEKPQYIVCVYILYVYIYIYLFIYIYIHIKYVYIYIHYIFKKKRENM